MNDADRLAYDKHIDSVMIQNDVLESARDEGLAQGMAQGIEKGMAQGLEKGMAQGLEKGMAQGALREKLFLQPRLRRVYSISFVQLRAGQGGTAPLEE